MSEPFWSALGARAGAGGVDYEGVWNPATPYVAGDVVRHNGVDYLAVNPSTGVDPGVAAALNFLGARLTHSVSQDSIHSATVALTFDTETYDDGFHTPAAPTRLTIPAGLGGRYLIVGQASVGGNTSHWLSLRLNGTTIIAAIGPLGATGQVDGDVTAIRSLVPGDYVEFVVTQVIGANRPVVVSPSSPVFSIQGLGRVA